MKRLLLSIVFAAGIISAKAQTTPLVTNWSLVSPSSTLITPNTGATVAYNPATKHLLFPDRNNKINVLSSADGTFIKELKVDAAWTEGFKYNKMRVDANGVIYAVNLATGAGTLTIHRWENEDDQAPTTSTITVAARTGDSFGLFGTGNNTKLYFSGSANKLIYVCSVNATNIALERTIDLTTGAFGAGWARSSISPITENELLIAGPSGTYIRRVVTAPGGTAIIAADTKVFNMQNMAFANAEYFSDGAKKYMTVHGAVMNSLLQQVGVEMEVYNITDFATPELTAQATLMTPPVAQNTSANADMAVVKNADGTHTFYHSVFANGLASYTSAAPLPVAMTSFTAALVKGESTLTWSTASEKNNKGFDVLRSTDGVNFSSVGFVAAKGQNGNAATALNYSFVDRSATAGVNYYQLNQIDLDGKSELSKDIVTVEVGLNSAGITAFPNPATSYVNVSTGGLDFKGLKYELFDASGKKVLTQKAKSGEQQISLSGLTPSVYFLKVSKDNVPQKTIKIIKQ